MHNTDDLDSAWDNLDSEFGLEPDPTSTHTKPQPQAKTPVPVVESKPAPELELHAGALFDPGPEHVLEETDHVAIGATADNDEEFDDTDSGELFDTVAAPATDAQEGDGKRKRKRRRRKKKRGNGDPNATPSDAVANEGDETSDVTVAVVPDDEALAETVVEEGEAPELVEDDEETPPPSAVDEEFEAEAITAKQEWNVMTWSDLVSKLHRPN